MHTNATLQPSFANVKVTPIAFVIGMLFVCLLLASNICSFKVISFALTPTFTLDLPAAVLFFPLTYLFDDIVTEVYGFKLSRLIIWTGLFCSGLCTLCTWFAVSLPPASIWTANIPNGQQAFELVLGGSSRIFLASAVAYFFGEFLNSIILAKLKVMTAGKYFPLRVTSSTAVGAAIDTSIFCHIAFFNVLPEVFILKLIITLYLVKLIYEIIMLPVTYWLTNWLKRIDGIDHYDYDTNFNPFSLKLN